MKTHLTIRALERGDIDGVRPVLDGTGLFPADMLNEMVEPYVSGQAPHIWLLAQSSDRTIGFAYCEPERMTTDADQAGARAFYVREGFIEEGRIRDFYAPGQTKIIFSKQL